MTTTPEKIVNAILADLADRAGFDHAWDGTDAGVRDEIRNTWATIIAQQLAPLRTALQDILTWSTSASVQGAMFNAWNHGSRVSPEESAAADDMWRRAREALS